MTKLSPAQIAAVKVWVFTAETSTEIIVHHYTGDANLGRIAGRGAGELVEPAATRTFEIFQLQHETNQIETQKEELRTREEMQQQQLDRLNQSKSEHPEQAKELDSKAFQLKQEQDRNDFEYLRLKETQEAKENQIQRLYNGEHLSLDQINKEMQKLENLQQSRYQEFWRKQEQDKQLFEEQRLIEQQKEKEALQSLQRKEEERKEQSHSKTQTKTREYSQGY